MFDFSLSIEDIEQEATLLHFVVFLLVYGWVILRSRCFLQPEIKADEHRWQQGLLWMGLLGLCVCGFTMGDFYHYADIVFFYENGDELHLEPFYIWLLEALKNNYFLWRCVIWGMGLCLFYVTTKRLEIPSYTAGFILFALFVLTYSYARASLAFTLFALGFSFLCKPLPTKWLSYLIGLAIIALCPCFHSSAYVLCGLTLCLLIPKNKWSVIIMVSVFPILLLLCLWAFNQSDALMKLFPIQYIEDSIDFYKYEYDGVLGFGIAARIKYIFEFSVYYLSAIIAILLLTQPQEDDKVGRSTRCLAMLVLSNVLVSSAIWFFPIETKVFYYRTLYMSAVPISLMVADAAHRKLIRPKWIYGLVLVGILFVLYSTMYGIYIKKL